MTTDASVRVVVNVVIQVVGQARHRARAAEVRAKVSGVAPVRAHGVPTCSQQDRAKGDTCPHDALGDRTQSPRFRCCAAYIYVDEQSKVELVPEVGLVDDFSAAPKTRVQQFGVVDIVPLFDLFPLVKHRKRVLVCSELRERVANEHELAVEELLAGEGDLGRCGRKSSRERWPGR